MENRLEDSVEMRGFHLPLPGQEPDRLLSLPALGLTPEMRGWRSLLGC